MTDTTTDESTTQFGVSDFTRSQFNADSIVRLANSWINVLDVQGTGHPDFLLLTVEFVTPLTDGRTRWMKTVVMVSKDDYMLREKKVIDLLVATVEKARLQIKASQRA